MSFVERIKVTDGTEVASVNASNQLEVAEANSNAIKTAVELIDNAISGSEMQVDIVASLPAGTNNIGDVDVLSVPAPLNVVGGGTEAAALRVTIANNSTGVVSVDDNGTTLSVDDGGSSITVDGTVAATQSGTWNITNVSGTVSLPTGAATSANQSTVITALQLLDDVVAVDGSAALTKLYQVGGTDGTNAQILSTNASGHLNIADGGNSITVDGTVAISGTVPVSDASGSLTVDNPTLTSLNDAVAIIGDSTLPTKFVAVGGLFGSETRALSLTDDSELVVAGTIFAKGDVAHGSIFNSSPIAIGGYASSTTPTVVDAGDVCRIWTTLSGAVNIADGNGTISIDDGAGSITVDGTVGVSGTVTVADGGGSLTVDGTVAATQSGTWNITNVSGTVSLPTGAATSANQSTMITALQLLDNVVATDGSAALTQLYQVGGTDGTNAQILSTNASGHLNIADGGNSITVDGTFWQATQPVSIAAAVAVTDNSGSLTVDDGGSSLTIDGTVTANLGSGTNYVGNVRLTDGTTNAEVVPLAGYNAQAVAIVDGSGNQITSFGGGTQYTEGDTDATITGTAMMFETNTGTSALGVVSASNPLPVSDNGTTLSIDDGGGIITVDGTVSITANSSVNLSQVGGNTVVTGGTNGTLAIGGIQAHDAIYSGNNPVVIGGVSSSATPTAVAVGDVTRLWTTTSGAVHIADGNNTISIDDGAGSITVDGTVSITANSAVNVAQFGGTNVVTGGTAGTQAVGGIQAHDAALSNNNPILGGSYYALTPSDVASGDLTRTWGSPKGATIIGAKYEASPPNWALSGDTVYHLTLASDGRLRVDVDFTGKSITTVGNAAHDAVDSGNPNKIGAKAIAHGTNPTAVAADDRTNLYANRHGILWTISGHPNLQTAEYFTDAARTNDNVLPLISAGTKYVITGITVIASAANTVNVSVRIGFGAAAVPTQGASGADAVTGVVLSHPNIPPGSGFSKGHAGGIVGIGGDGEDLYITCSAPTTGSLIVQVDYYTIES